MYDDSDVETYSQRLRSSDPAMRALAADEATDGVSDWGKHSYTESQARRMTKALVDALAIETADVARESMVNALSALVAWDLAPLDEVARAIALPRPADDPTEEYWIDVEDWAKHKRASG